MIPQAIIDEMFCRQEELLREAEAMREIRRLTANEPGFFQKAGQVLRKFRQNSIAQFRARLNTPVFTR